MAMSTNVNSISPAFPVEVAVRHICAHHRNLARVFRALEAHAEAIAGGKCSPDFILIAAMLRYIAMFSYRVHHPADEEFLLSAMRQSGAPGHVIDSVIGAHNSGAKQFAALQDAFNAWGDKPDMHNAPFLELAHDYISFEFDHMSYEESVVLPCAVDMLPAKDWTPIADAFRSHDDPLFGIKPGPDLAPLHHLLFAGPVSH
jgi:hemerythrin-like domain-containing protein